MHRPGTRTWQQEQKRLASAYSIPRTVLLCNRRQEKKAINHVENKSVIVQGRRIRVLVKWFRSTYGED
jgi:hypothetical protein